MEIEYTHSDNVHSLDGPRAVMPKIMTNSSVKSLLDVGCGAGTWLKAGSDLGITDFFGVDGVDIPRDQLLIPAKCFAEQDLTKSWNLGRRFDMAICLEVAEHLDEPFAATLVESLVNHADLIFFSGACPGQGGQHHVNCQWPEYWQGLFNKQGYVCDDELRWQMWNDERVEPWYRQNGFIARRAPEKAGKEPRIKPVVHPGVWSGVPLIFQECLRIVDEGRLPVPWYLTLAPTALTRKLVRVMQR